MSSSIICQERKKEKGVKKERKKGGEGKPWKLNLVKPHSHMLLEDYCSYASND